MYRLPNARPEWICVEMGEKSGVIRILASRGKLRGWPCAVLVHERVDRLFAGLTVTDIETGIGIPTSCTSRNKREALAQAQRAVDACRATPLKWERIMTVREPLKAEFSRMVAEAEKKEWR